MKANTTTRPTQLDLYEAARRKMAEGNELMMDMVRDGNGPTVSELAKLKAKRPEIWGRFPDSLARPD